MTQNPSHQSMSTAHTGLVIDEPWEDLPANAKYDRMLVRRAKIRADSAAYRRHLAVLSKVLGGEGIKDGPVLEVACGMGFHTLELGRLGFTRVIASDIDPALSELMHHAAERFGVPVRAFAGDACHIPIATGTCAAVISHSFFEHVYDVDLALAEQIRVLRPGGRLIVFDGNLLNPRLLFDLVVRYPIRTRGRHGGLRWIFGKRKIYRNLYGYLPLGRDEDVKTPRWWRRRLAREPRLRILSCATGGAYTHATWPGWLRPFIGSCVIVAERTAVDA